MTLGKHYPHFFSRIGITVSAPQGCCEALVRGSQCHRAGLVEPQVDCLRMQEGRGQDPWFQTSHEGRLRFVILVKHFPKCISFSGVTQKKVGKQVEKQIDFLTAILGMVTEYKHFLEITDQGRDFFCHRVYSRIGCSGTSFGERML